ncbi:HAD hydrolase-like protein [Thiolapillus sp.]
MYEYLIFDLDGTLTDPKEGISRSINHALDKHGFDALDENTLDKYIGPPLDWTFSQLTGVTNHSAIQALVDSYRDRYAQVGYSENRIYDGVSKVLKKLSENSDITLGICTSKRADFAEKILELFNIDGFFQFVNGGDVGIHKWQQLEGLLESGTVSRNSIMIGDRNVDLSAARKK